ncbi:MAG: ATP-binding protein [Euryarchaeota archaeon]|nr:ATP-binding protein [Euryarchaeota archaeon]
MSIDEHDVGRITGKSVMHLELRVPYASEVSLGEILVGETEGTGHEFLLRVTDLLHGAETAMPDWAQRVAGSMMRLDRDNAKYDLHDREERLYQQAVTTPLGFIDRTTGSPRLRKPKTLPPQFSRIRRLTDADLEFLAAYDQDLRVGLIRSGSHVINHAVGIHGRYLPHHIGVFATTGMGKSNLMKSFAASVMQSRRYGMLILDPHGEYYDGGAGVLPDGRKLQGLSHLPESTDRLLVYSSRQLPGPYNQLKISAAEVTISDLKAVYSFSQAQEECLWALNALFGETWLLDLATSTPEELSVHFGSKFHEMTLAVLKRRAEQVLRFDVLHADPNVTVTGGIMRALEDAKVVLVDTSSLWEPEEMLVSAVLARTVFRRNKEKYKRPQEFQATPPVLIAVEEAQRVLQRREGEVSIFAQIAREGRKFKTGICAVTQQPKLIPEELLSQFNTFFILGLADERDREILAGSAKQDISALVREVQTLEPGEAIIASPNVPFAVPARVDLYEDLLARQVASNGVKAAAAPKAFY